MLLSQTDQEWFLLNYIYIDGMLRLMLYSQSVPKYSSCYRRTKPKEQLIYLKKWYLEVLPSEKSQIFKQAV